MFSGSIPSELCQLSKLQILDPALNNLSGGIPRCFSKLLENNLSQQDTTIAAGPIAMSSSPSTVPEPAPAISGNIEWPGEKVSVVMKGTSLEYTTTLRLLDSMDLSSNMLNGSIPEDLAELSGLRSLNLSHNHLSGNIPSNIGGLNSIESLDLSDNQLFDLIPSSMSTLTSLNHLNLSYNNLSGEIPKGNQLQTLNDPSIYAGNLQLCEAPLPKKCPSNYDSAQPIMNTGAHGNEADENNEYFVISSGYATCFWGVIGALIIRKD